MRLAFDIETDGLCRDLTVIHCLVTQDLDTGQVTRFDDSGKNHETITTGLTSLMVADEIWGHNVIGFDQEAIIELYPFWEFKGKIYDTLILSRLFFTDMLSRDFRSKPALMPGNLYGRHSLEAWGHRLGVHKSEYGKSLKNDWSTYTPEMLEYCVQDVAVSVELIKMFEPKLEQYKECIELEHEVAKIMSWQERKGFPFDINKAHKLEGKLRTELDQLSDDMRSTFNFVDGGSFTPKRPNKTKGYHAGCEFSRLKEFNPTSRQHIAWAFKTFRGWEPTEYTNTGIAKIDESVLKDMNTEESNKFARILELQKHLGQLSEGKNSWLKKVGSDGRIHHSCVLNTNTGRNAHMGPNLGNVPSSSEYRELFHCGVGRVQVNSDCMGLELRCLSHYLTRFDGGLFTKTLLEGDIHQHLSTIYGTTRQTGKSVTYALIYGGGNTKLGLTAGASKGDAAKKGKEIRTKVLEGLEGFKSLTEAVTHRAESTGILKGLDGRPIRIQGKIHASLNYLLQSSGAIITKKWLLESYRLMNEAKLDYWPLIYCHDELGVSAHPDHVEQIEFCLNAAIKNVENAIKFRCPLDVETKHGGTWADVH